MVKNNQKSRFTTQIIKFYNFTKGGTDIVDQLNDYYTTRSKSCHWVMVALSYMLETATVNGSLKKHLVVFEKLFRYFKHIFI